MYYLNDGTQVSRQQIATAFADGRAVIVHSRAEDQTATGLRLDGVHCDTRGDCYSMWDECWTEQPATIMDALGAAS